MGSPLKDQREVGRVAGTAAARGRPRELVPEGVWMDVVNPRRRPPEAASGESLYNIVHTAVLRTAVPTTLYNYLPAATGWVGGSRSYTYLVAAVVRG